MFEFNPLLTLSSTEFQVEEHGHPPFPLGKQRETAELDRSRRETGGEEPIFAN